MANGPPLTGFEGLVSGFTERTEQISERRSQIERLRIMRKQQQDEADARRRQLAIEEADMRRRAAEEGFTFVSPIIEDPDKLRAVADASVEQADFLPPVMEGGPPAQFVQGLGDVGEFMVKTGPSIEEQKYQRTVQQDLQEGEALRGIVAARSMDDLRSWIRDLDPSVMALPGVRQSVLSRMTQFDIAGRAGGSDPERALQTRAFFEAWNTAEQEFRTQRAEVEANNRRLGSMRGDSDFQDPDRINFVEIFEKTLERLQGQLHRVPR